MPSPWKGSMVRLKWMPTMGTWIVTARVEKDWVEIAPRDDASRILANLSPCGKLWVRTQDLTRDENLQETLL